MNAKHHYYKEIGAFLAVARYGGFSHASKELGVSQPTLSRQVSRLEDLMGASLFTRNTRVVTLTAVGEALARDLEAAEDRISLAFQAARRSIAGTSGKVTLGFNAIPINQNLPSILSEFLQLYPEIKIELLHLSSVDQIERLLGSEIDVGLGSLPVVESQFNSVHLADHTIAALVAKDSELACRDTISAEDVTGKTLIVGRDPDWSTFNNRIFSYLLKHDVTKYRVLRAYDYESLSALVGAGAGIGFFVDIDPQMARMSVRTLPFGDQTLTVPLFMNWRRASANKTLPHFVNFFFDRVT